MKKSKRSNIKKRNQEEMMKKGKNVQLLDSGTFRGGDDIGPGDYNLIYPGKKEAYIEVEIEKTDGTYKSIIMSEDTPKVHLSIDKGDFFILNHKSEIMECREIKGCRDEMEELGPGTFRGGRSIKEGSYHLVYPENAESYIEVAIEKADGTYTLIIMSEDNPRVHLNIDKGDFFMLDHTARLIADRLPNLL